MANAVAPSQNSALLTLPSELHLQIFLDLEPEELLFLSQTCRDLRETMSDVSIWRVSLRTMCNKNNLFEPSFPIDTMELADLQRAAMGPALWIKKVTRHSGSSAVPLPHFERSIGSGHWASEGASEKQRIAGLSLVPGGRYLVSYAPSSIALQDLGVPIPSYMSKTKPEVIATCYAGDNFFFRRMSQVCFRRSCLRVGIAIKDEMPGKTYFRVYEVGPLPEDRVFRLIEEQRADRKLQDLVLVDWDWVAVYYEDRSEILVWHLPRQEYVHLGLILPGVLAPFDMVVSDDTFVAFTNFGVYVWPMNDFHTKCDPHLAVSYPIRRSHQFTSGGTNYTYSPTGMQRQAGSSEVVYDAMKSFVESDVGRRLVKLNRYELHLIGDNTTQTLISEAAFTSDRGGTNWHPQLLNHAYSSGHLSTLAHRYDTSHKVILSPIRPKSESEWKIAVMDHTIHRLYVSGLLCPSTGRWVYTCSHAHGERGLNSPHLVDFLFDH